MSLETDLQAALPGLVVSAPDWNNVVFTRELTPAEWAIAEAVGDPVRRKAAQAKADIVALGNWATWTQADFDTWCTNNLMTDAAVDATTLSAALKTNIKANNAFTRNGGKMLIAIRNVAFLFLKLQGINGS